uniref:Zf-CGNR domain-containing protein n=1 Tax=Haemonchus contortus TaxID=6289 RepID=A0A7I4XUW9_HAECO
MNMPFAVSCRTTYLCRHHNHELRMEA